MRPQSALPDTCSINPMQAVGCLLQTRAEIRARGRSCCRSGCIGAGSTGDAVAAAQEAVGTPSIILSPNVSP